VLAGQVVVKLSYGAAAVGWPSQVREGLGEDDERLLRSPQARRHVVRVEIRRLEILPRGTSDPSRGLPSHSWFPSLKLTSRRPWRCPDSPRCTPYLVRIARRATPTSCSSVVRMHTPDSSLHANTPHRLTANFYRDPNQSLAPRVPIPRSTLSPQPSFQAVLALYVQYRMNAPAIGFWYSGRMDLLSFSTSWENGQSEGLECNQTAAGYSIRIRGSYAFG